MNKVLLEHLLKIFACIANVYQYLLFENVRDFIKSVLLKDFSDSVIDRNLVVFRDFYYNYSEIAKSSSNKNEMIRLLLEDIKIINNEISRKQKFIILLRLMLFEKFLLGFSNQSSSLTEFTKILNEVAALFQVATDEFNNSKYFISGTLYNFSLKQNLLIVSGKKLIQIDIPYMQRENLFGQIFFFYLKSIKMIIFYSDGLDNLKFNDKTLYPNHIYELQRGLFISGQDIEPIYYNQVLRILSSKEKVNLILEAKGIEYRFKHSTKGINKLDLTIEGGEMIGMLGRSGAGKSTLLNLLNGNLKPSKGNIQINAFDISLEADKLIGLIGYVPQDDLLIEELSVFRNLYLNAQLCFSNLTSAELTGKVNNLLIELNIYESRNLKVGTPLNKYISGGQRKKLNIALELIREPWILYADEPTSGLSSSDSEEIMQLLSELAISGRIVFVNVHQPSSDIFKLFDKVLIMDNDGFPAYFGNPANSLSYFHSYNNTQLAITDKCDVCGNLNTESIFKALEEKQVNDMGEYSNERKTSAQQWHALFIKSVQPAKEVVRGQLPVNHLVQPNSIKQFYIFFHRNFLSKITNQSYVALALTISPFLAVILSFLCKSGIDTETKLYTFGENENITAFLFMSVIVSLFVGLIISAEEIIRDRRILVRESFLRLNKSSYIFSKVTYLFALSAIQTVLYVTISNYILEIHGMFGLFWIILFSTSCFANLLGLLISSVFNSVVVIYILVPLLIVPQILLSGVVVSFEKLNEKVSYGKYVPLVGDIMVSRWAYEALLVSQFRYNKFQNHFFEVEKQMSNIQFNYVFIIPELKDVISNVRSEPGDQLVDIKLHFIWNELQKLYEYPPQLSIPVYSADLNIKNDLAKIENYLDKLETILSRQNKLLSQMKDSTLHKLIGYYGSNIKFLGFKKSYYNTSLSEFMLKRQSLHPYIMTPFEIIRKLEPVYQNSSSNYGRSQFLASDKKIGPIELSTPVFNVMVIWLMSFLILSFLLIYSNRYYDAK
jgi:ABC transport system ATP-binding/permease protein